MTNKEMKNKFNEEMWETMKWYIETPEQLEALFYSTISGVEDDEDILSENIEKFQELYKNKDIEEMIEMVYGEYDLKFEHFCREYKEVK